MFRKLGYTVLELNRLSFAGIKLDVAKGKFRILLPIEVQQIKQQYSI
jgi:16S rRNA U516 pseudouridylate synthase RsuA-like enzyme